MAKHKSDGPQNGEFRDHLAKRIVSWSIIAVVFFGLLALGIPVAFSLLGLLSPRPELTGADKAVETAFGVFTMLGPMMAGWVGVVIGYYFANKAHQDASNNTQKLLERMSPAERLRTSTMKRAMRLPPLIDTVSVVRDAERRITNPLIDALSIVQRKNRTRAPLVETMKDGTQRMVAVLHESTLYDFLHRKLQEGIPLDRLTIQDLLDDPHSARRLEGSLKALCESDPLLEAKKLMERNSKVQDVVITTTGQLDAPMVGWVTNVDVLRHIIETTNED